MFNFILDIARIGRKGEWLPLTFTPEIMSAIVGYESAALGAEDNETAIWRTEILADGPIRQV